MAFFRDLTARGLTGVKLVISDAHAGLVAAAAAILPGAAWQRCRTHCSANLMSATPKSSWPWVKKTLLHTVYDQLDADAVNAQFDLVLDALEHKLPKAFSHLDAARADILAFTAFPKELWKQIWSNERAVESGDQAPHRCRRDLPQPGLDHPPRGRRGRRGRRAAR